MEDGTSPTTLGHQCSEMSLLRLYSLPRSRTLLFQACKSDMSQDDLYEQVEYLVKVKGAKCDIRDGHGKTALFYLVNSRIGNKERTAEAQKQSIKIAHLLIANGCDLSAVDSEGFTAAMEALGSITHICLAEVLLKEGCKVLSPPEVEIDQPPKCSLLHRIVNNFDGYNDRALKVLHLLTKYKYDSELKKMACHVDAKGYTPLLSACTKSEYCGYALHAERTLSLSYKEITQNWEEAVKFFKFLITKCHSDVNAKVTEKFRTLEFKLRVTNWIYMYQNRNHGGNTAVQMLLSSDPKFSLIGTDRETRASVIISYLIKNGANIDCHNMNGMTPFGTAVFNKYICSIEFLVKNTRCNVNMPIIIKQNDQPDIDEHAHNHVAYREPPHNIFTLFATLIDCGIDVNARSNIRDNHHGTFLHILLQKENIERSALAKIVDKLVHTPFDFDAQDDKGMTVMHLALRSNTSELNDCLELESKLMSKCSLTIKNIKKRTPLHYVFKKKTRSNFQRGKSSDPSQLLRLVLQKADGLLLNEQDHDGNTILHLAAKFGFFVCIYLLTKKKERVDIHIKNHYGNTPLALAVVNRNDSCALALIQCGASLNVDVIIVSDAEFKRRKAERKRKISKCILNRRMDYDEEEISDSDEDMSDSDEEEKEIQKEPWTLKTLRYFKIEENSLRVPLYKAALTSEVIGTILQIVDAPINISGITHKDMIKMAMETGKFNIALQIMNASFSDPKTAKLLSNSYEKNRNLLHLLPLSIENQPGAGYTSILEIARLLLSMGIATNSCDEYGCTPIQYAILNRHFELANYLAENGSGFEVNRKDKFGRGYLTAVMWRYQTKGIDSNAWNFLEKLISKGMSLEELIEFPLNPDLVQGKDYPNVNDKDPDYFQGYLRPKTTALIFAITCTDFDSHISKKFLELGANPNTPDAMNISPLMHAVMRNNTHFVRQLLHEDYDPNAKDDQVDKNDSDAKKKQLVDNSIFRLKDSNAESDESSEESEIEEDSADDKNKKEKEKQKEFKPVKKTSSVNIDQKDTDGRTALHYINPPSELGTFDNAEMAFILIKGGGKSKLDKVGFTPFTLAVKMRATNVMEELTKHGQGSTRNVTIQYDDEFFVDDGVVFTGTVKPNFQKDAERVLSRHDSDMMVDDVFVHEVDKNCNITDGKLVKDKDLDVWCDVLLTKVDVLRLSWGLYNFYKLQLVYQPDKKLYILFTRWGRIGDSGQYQHTPFQEENMAIKEFAKVFREKTGNKWIDFKSYERNPKKYRLLEDVARKAPPEQKDVKLNLKSSVATSLPHYLYSLTRTLMSPKIIEATMKDSKCVDIASLPFGQLNKERLMQGKELLERIAKYIEKVEDYKGYNKKDSSDKDNIEKLTRNCEMISELSNEYFHVIPQQDFSFEKCAPLNDNTIIRHLYFISNLLNYEIISKMLIAAMTHKSKTNPVDFVYRCLGCKIELMEQDDPMSQLILRNVISSSYKRVVGIYKLSREGEEERLKATKLGNHCFLWHGTSTTNLLSILTRGLLVAPPEAASHAWAYGRGIYFSDRFTKSDNYVHSRHGNRSFMLLCQVALGNCVPYKDNDNDNDESSAGIHLCKSNEVKNSTVVNETSIADCEWLVLKSGVKIRYDSLNHKTNHVHHSREYIVEDPAQVCLRYLIEYKQ